MNAHPSDEEQAAEDARRDYEQDVARRYSSLAGEEAIGDFAGPLEAGTPSVVGLSARDAEAVLRSAASPPAPCEAARRAARLPDSPSTPPSP